MGEHAIKQVFDVLTGLASLLLSTLALNESVNHVRIGLRTHGQQVNISCSGKFCAQASLVFAVCQEVSPGQEAEAYLLAREFDANSMLGLVR